MLQIGIQAAVSGIVRGIEREVQSRARRAANELRNAELEVLRGQRSGRIYRVPYTRRRYQASAPGEPPASRTGTLRNSFRPRMESEKSGNRTTLRPSIVSDVAYAEILEDGSGKAAPRPMREPVLQQAFPRIEAIFREPYQKG